MVSRRPKSYPVQTEHGLYVMLEFPNDPSVVLFTCMFNSCLVNILQQTLVCFVFLFVVTEKVINSDICLTDRLQDSPLWFQLCGLHSLLLQHRCCDCLTLNYNTYWRAKV